MPLENIKISTLAGKRPRTADYVSATQPHGFEWFQINFDKSLQDTGRSELRLVGFEGWHDPVHKDELETTGQVHSLNFLKDCRTDTVPNPEGF